MNIVTQIHRKDSQNEDADFPWINSPFLLYGVIIDNVKFWIFIKSHKIDCELEI